MPDDFQLDLRHNRPQRGASPRSGGELVPWLVAIALLAAIVAGWWMYSKRVAEAERAAFAAAVASEEAAQQAALAARANAEADAGRGDSASPLREQIVDDSDGQLLWVSPTAGPPISLAYAPAGTQCLVFLRPALLAAHPEGEKVLAALGPWGREAADALRSLTHAELANLDAVLASILVAADGDLAVKLRAELVQPWDEAELARRWPDAEAREHGEQAFRAAGDRACFLAPNADGKPGRTLVACPADLTAELIDSAGDAPLLARDLESLLASTDAERAVTVIVAPNFLDAGGSCLLEGAAALLREALAEFLDSGATAVALSAYWDHNFFVELRAAPALNVAPRVLAAVLRKRLDVLPGKMDDLILAQAWPPYGHKVLARFPGMLRQLALTTRRGDADKHALLRAYLPAIAGHNLLMGAELLLTQQGGESAAATGVAAAPRTIDERLAASTSLSLPKDTLQRALELLAEDLGVEVVIEGNELRTEGITQNQTLEIDLRDRSAGEILVEILRRANPDRTADGPADPRQKLVYVVEQGAAAAGGRIIVTTRAAAQRRGLPLPAVFVGAGE